MTSGFPGRNAGTGIGHWMFCTTNMGSTLSPDEVLKAFIEGDPFASKHMSYVAQKMITLIIVRGGARAAAYCPQKSRQGILRPHRIRFAGLAAPPGSAEIGNLPLCPMLLPATIERGSRCLPASGASVFRVYLIFAAEAAYFTSNTILPV